VTIDADFRSYVEFCRQRAETSLDHWLPKATTQPERLHAAMRHGALGGGKRIRPVLVYATGMALGTAEERLDGPACAIELIHAYSLVHDDLPAMDDDNLRRGRPTCHRAFDEATAILAGDALQTLAFSVLCKETNPEHGTAARLAMIENLASAAGSRGMAGGQAIDLASVGRRIDLPQLENMHIHKTGALIRASVRMGILGSPEASTELAQQLDRYAKCIGLAFQVQDDILDVESDTETLGKTSGKDYLQEKPTYPALLGLKEAKAMAERLHREALESLQALDHRANHLRSLADYIVSRTY